MIFLFRINTNNFAQNLIKLMLKKIILFALLSTQFLFQSCDKDDENSTTTFAIGDFHQGGVIFYLDASLEHGLVSAVSDQSFEAVWGCPPRVINGADGLAVGTGAQNTLDIVNGCSSTISGFAAELCDQLEMNGFSDWYLPSKDELNELYINREQVNETSLANNGSALEGTEYWSSSLQNSNTVWIQNFNAGNQSGTSEDAKNNVRAIRSF